MKRHENRVAATYKPLTASERSILRMRGNKRRASIQRGVVRVHFVKLLPADAPRVWPAVPTCRQCGGYVLPTETVCAGCWAASIDPPSPPWEAPHCFVFDCLENAHYLIDGIASCWQHRIRAEREAEADRQRENLPSPPWPGGAA